MEISIKWNVCRVCLKENDIKVTEMSSIFKDAKLPKQIYDCSGIIMDPNDSLPDKICRKCLTVLKCAIHFRTLCRNSDEYLQSVMQKTKTATALMDSEKRRDKELHLDESDITDSIFDINEKIDQFTDEIKEKDHIEMKSISKLNKSNIGKFNIEKVKGNKSDIRGVGMENGKLPVKQLKNALDRKVIEMISNEMEDTENLNEEYDNGDEDDDDDDENDIRRDLNDVNFNKKDAMYEESFMEDTNQREEYLYVKEFDEYNDDNGTEKEQLISLNYKLPSNDINLKTIEYKSKTTNSHDSEYIYILKDSEIKTESINCQYVGSDELETNEEGKTDNNSVDVIDMVEEIDNTDGNEYDEDIRSIENVEFLDDYESSDENHQEQKQQDEDHLQNRTYGNMIRENREGPAMARKKFKISNEFICDVCGNHFPNRSVLNYHMRVHTNEKNFECELCFKRFNAACNLTAHMRVHTGEKPYECQYCNRRFADRSTHIKHERIHTNERPFSCNICGKAFSLSTTLKAHEKVHTGEKPFKCEPCAKSFKLPHQLKAHLKTHLHKVLSLE